MNRKLLLLCWWLLMSGCTLYQLSAQNITAISTEGKEFYAAFLNIIPNPPNNLRFVISSRTGASGTISMPSNPNFTPIPFSVGANATFQSPNISSIYTAGTNETVENKGFYIKSNNNDISVTAINLSPNRTEASMVLPLTALGTLTEYRINTVQKGTNNGSLSEFVIVATEDNTVIEITPSANTFGGKLANTPFTVTLQKGQTVQYQTTEDFTGTHIRSVAGNCKKPFAVFAGTNTVALTCFNGSNGGGSSQHVYEQQFPTHTWGTDYIVAPYAGLNGIFYKIVASQDNTTVSISNNFTTNNVTVHTLQARLEATTVPVCIKADKPISVIQISQNSGCSGVADPSLLVLSALSQTTTQATFNTIELGNNGIHYINVIMKTADIAQLRMNGRTTDNNGTPLSQRFTPVVACNAYSIAAIPIGVGRTGLFTTNLTATTGFSAYAYGYSQVDMYAYAVGASFENLATNFTVKGTTTVCNKTTLTFSGVGTNVSSYTWDFADGTTPLKGQTVEKTFTQSGTYKVNMTAEFFGGTGCTATTVVSKELEVTVITPKVVTAKIANARTPFEVCGLSDTLVVEPVAGAKYQWLLNNQNITGATKEKLGISQSGNYAVKVTLDSCSFATSAIQKVDFLKVVAQIQGDSVRNVCENTVLRATETDSTLYTYEWRRNGEILPTKTPTLTATQNGSYTVTVKRSSCSATSKPVVVNITPKPTALIIQNSPLRVCDSTVLEAEIVENATYSWTKDNVIVAKDLKTNVLKINTSGLYTVTVKVGSCTVVSKPVYVQVTKTPIAKFMQKSPVFFCKTAKITAQRQDSATYSWWWYGILQATTTVPEYTATQSGIYRVEVRVGNCVKVSDTLNLLPNRIKATIIQKSPIEFCEKGVLQADSTTNTNDVTYEWWLNGKLVGTKASLNVSSSGNYVLKAKQETCVDSTNIDVKVNQFPTNFAITAAASSICPDSSMVLRIATLPNATYEWRRNNVVLPQNTPQVTVNQIGTYSVKVSIGENCSQTATTEVRNFTPIPLTLKNTPTTFDISATEVYPNPTLDQITLKTSAIMGITLSIDNGTQWKNITWWADKQQIQGQNQSSLFVQKAGNYQAKGTDSNGCPQNSAVLPVVLPNLPTLRCVVVNSLGQIVGENTHNLKASEPISFSLAYLSAGVYWLQISTDNAVKTVRIVKLNP